MSTILVIQPYKMLQQAFAVALHSDYQIHVQETFPELPAIHGFDAVIIDAASLAERKGDTELRAVQTLNIPTVWIDNGGAPLRSVRENLIIVKPPVDKDALKKALLGCLAPSTKAPPKAPRSLATPAPTKTSKAKFKEKSAVPAADEPQFIELVDVVEVAPVPGENETSQK
jgi:hypothetical protein